MTTAYDRLLDVFQQRGSKIIKSARGVNVQCPAHDDRNPSLALSDGGGSVLVHCFAGCQNQDIVAALGWGMADLFDTPRTSYTYPDRVVTRSYNGDGSKTFRQSVQRPGDRTQLYRLDRLANAETVYLVEGEKDVHALETLGVSATTAPMGAGNFDKCDVSPLHDKAVVAVVDRDDAGRKWAAQVKAALDSSCVLEFRQAAIGKDAADHVAAGYGVEDLQPYAGQAAAAGVEEVHGTFKRWLGDGYDLDALDVVLATAAVERLDGDPVWLLLLSGSGNAKTETVQALAGAGAYVTSTVTSEGALLSATSKRETSKDATGGLLRKVGARGLLVVKDVTSILSMNKDMRGQVLAALREVYDGRWERNVGTDGGKTLTWEGRLVLIGAVTSEYDRHHAVISAMGDRFALVRVDSGIGRMASGRQALRNVGSEIQMRAELADIVGRLLNRADATGTDLSDQTAEALLAVADLVTLARTAVEKDYKGTVLEAHAPEAPTRFAKMLGQIVRGGLALGLDLDHCMRLAFRVAHDSLNPLRLECLLDVAGHPYSRTSEVSKRIQKPRITVDRYLQELHILGLLHVDEADDGKGWRYSLSDRVDDLAVTMLQTVTGKVSTRKLGNKEGNSEPVHSATDFSGHAAELPILPRCQDSDCDAALYAEDSAAVGLCFMHQRRSA